MSQFEKISNKTLIAGGHNIAFQKNWSFPLLFWERDILFKKIVKAAVGQNNLEVNLELNNNETLISIREKLYDIFSDHIEEEFDFKEFGQYEQNLPFSPMQIPEDVEDYTFGKIKKKKIKKKRKYVEKENLEEIIALWGSDPQPKKKKRKKLVTTEKIKKEDIYQPSKSESNYKPKKRRSSKRKRKKVNYNF